MKTAIVVALCAFALVAEAKNLKPKRFVSFENKWLRLLIKMFGIQVHNEEAW